MCYFEAKFVMSPVVECDKGTSGVAQVHSKWELVDYDEDSDEEDASGAGYVVRGVQEGLPELGML